MSSVISTASSSVSARMTPTSPATASNASTLPASEPVCAIAAPRDERTVLGEGDEAAPGAAVAQAVRAGDGEGGLGDHGSELAAERGRLGIEALAEAGGKHCGAARAGGRAAAQGLDHAGRRH